MLLHFALSLWEREKCTFFRERAEAVWKLRIHTSFVNAAGCVMPRPSNVPAELATSWMCATLCTRLAFPRLSCLTLWRMSSTTLLSANVCRKARNSFLPLIELGCHWSRSKT